mmetsp:Transcript_8483/g.13227  ORF Transcript_8483/g.13227 Transcript_8483/m.13227 type:complete len:298 (+) Transcript_8483:82-975(+)
MKPTHRNYSESFAQTTLQDPDHHLHNFQLHAKALTNSIQADAPNETPSISPVQTPVQDKGEVYDEDEDDDDSDSEEELALQLQTRLHPKKQEDFAALQSELLQWRRREERKILITCGNKERKRELTKALLTKETFLLRKIEILKNEAHSKMSAKKVERSISKMAQPKIWETCHGNVTVETPETNLALEMKGIYDDVRRKTDKTPARIGILQRMKLFLHRIHSSTTLIKDIHVLVNRELEILQRDTAELGNDMLEGMRTRLINLFAKLIFKTNTFQLHELRATKPKLLISKNLKPIIT